MTAWEDAPPSVQVRQLARQIEEDGNQVRSMALLRAAVLKRLAADLDAMERRLAAQEKRDA